MGLYDVNVINMNDMSNTILNDGFSIVTTDTVDIPSDTSDTNNIITAFTDKSYQNAQGAITTVTPGTYVGTKNINLANSAGKILVPFVLQSSGEPNTIEMQAPAGLVVKTASGT